MIIANYQFLCFCYERKNMLKGYGTNINTVFNADSNNVASYSKNGELMILSIL